MVKLGVLRQCSACGAHLEAFLRYVRRFHVVDAVCRYSRPVGGLADSMRSAVQR